MIQYGLICFNDYYYNNAVFPPDAECPTGYFGKSCRERCSGRCINNEPCDDGSGECSDGCQEGYIGAHCGDYKKMK